MTASGLADFASGTTYATVEGLFMKIDRAEQRFLIEKLKGGDGGYLSNWSMLFMLLHFMVGKDLFNSVFCGLLWW